MTMKKLMEVGARVKLTKESKASAEARHREENGATITIAVTDDKDDHLPYRVEISPVTDRASARLEWLSESDIEPFSEPEEKEPEEESLSVLDTYIAEVKAKVGDLMRQDQEMNKRIGELGREQTARRKKLKEYQAVLSKLERV